MSRETHGHWVGGRPTKLWTAHRSMISRCYNKSTDSYNRYGKRGITVCSRWLNGERGMSGFECFAEDVGNPPSENHSLDRINNNIGYQPGNVRWATSKQQANNRSSNRLVSAFGETLTISQWTDRTGLTEATLRHRLFKVKMEPEIALSTPNMRPRKSIK